MPTDCIFKCSIHILIKCTNFDSSVQKNFILRVSQSFLDHARVELSRNVTAKKPNLPLGQMVFHGSPVTWEFATGIIAVSHVSSTNYVVGYVSFVRGLHGTQ